MMTVKKAENELQKIQAAKGKLENELSELSIKIQAGQGEAKKSILSDLLSGTKTSDASISDAAKLKVEHEAKSEALPEIDQAIREAEKDLLLAQAEAKRSEAKRIRDQAAKHKLRTDELLEALKEHEGCKFVPYVPDTSLPPGTTRTEDISWKIPLSDALMRDAERLEREANTPPG